MKMVCMMLCMVVASVGAVKCQGVKEHYSLRICDDLRLLAAINDICCKKFQVALVPSKTMLLVFYNHSQIYDIELAKLVILFLF